MAAGSADRSVNDMSTNGLYNLILCFYFVGLDFCEFRKWVRICDILFVNFGLAWFPRLITYTHICENKNANSQLPNDS